MTLKVQSYAGENYWQTESPLKVMRNVFYFTLKALSVHKIFKFLSLLSGHV